MTLAEKLWIASYYGFRLTLRDIFDESAPQAERPAVKAADGGLAIWEPESDIDGWALVGFDVDWLVDQTLDTLDKAQIDDALPKAQKSLAYNWASLDQTVNDLVEVDIYACSPLNDIL